MSGALVQWMLGALFKQRFAGPDFTSVLGLLNHTIFRFARYRPARQVLVCEGTERNVEPLQLRWVRTRDVLQ